MAETLRSMLSYLKNYTPQVPTTLARQWVIDAYQRVLDRRRWSFQYGFGNWQVVNQFVGSVNAVFGSNQFVVASGTLPGDNTSIVGMQMRLSARRPYYNVTSNVDATHFTTDIACQEATAFLPFDIGTYYFQSEQPDLETLIVMVDRVNGWRFRLNVPMEEVENMDPQRSSTGPPFWLVSHGFNTQYLAALPAGVTDRYNQTKNSPARPWWEAWPIANAQAVLQYAYKRRLADLQKDTDTLPGFLRSKVLREAAMAELCNWPGTESMPNPKFNPVYANVHDKAFEDYLLDMEFVDERVANQTMRWIASYQNYPLPPVFSSRFWQQHAPTTLVTGSVL